MTSLLRCSLIIATLLLSSSCGTLFTGTSDLVTITSTPSGAKVNVDGMYIGVSPVTTTLKRSNDHTVLIRLDGYTDASAVITRSFNAISILNLLSPLCWLVDVVTGGIWKFDRDVLGVELEPIKKS
jgi:hypothetical protein